MSSARPPRLGRLLALSLFGPLALQVLPPFFLGRFGRPDMAKAWPQGATLAWVGFAFAAACLYAGLRARRTLKPQVSLLNMAGINSALWMLLEFGGRPRGPLSPLFGALSLNHATTAFALALASTLAWTLALAVKHKAEMSRAALATHAGICLFAGALLGYYALHPAMFSTSAAG